MSTNEGQVQAREDEGAATEQSPTDKLEGKQPPGSPIPGAQNPESTEIKKEQNPNTE